MPGPVLGRRGLFGVGALGQTRHTRARSGTVFHAKTKNPFAPVYGVQKASGLARCAVGPVYAGHVACAASASGATGLKYRGQRLVGATNEVFLHLLRPQREILASQGGACKLCPLRLAPANSTAWCR